MSDPYEYERDKTDAWPRPGDANTCPVCLMPLLSGEECVRHDIEEMIAWGTKYRRDLETQKARAEALEGLLRDIASAGVFITCDVSRRLMARIEKELGGGGGC